MAFAPMLHEEDPIEKIEKDISDLSCIDIFHNQVLVAVYSRPEKTRSGILLAHSTRDEDRFQSKIGLVLKKGPDAFVSRGEWEFPNAIEERDWVIFRPSDGWSITVNGVLCRILVDTSIKGRISHPDHVW